MIERPDQITPREQTLHQQELEVLQRQIEHAEAMKKLELEVAKIEARAGALFKIPIMLIKLPVMLVMAVGYVVAKARKQEVSDKYWDFLK